MFKYAIFDLDGTIANTLLDLANSTNKGLEYFGYEPQPSEKFKIFVGNGARIMVKRAMPDDATPEQLEKALEIFMEDYGRNYIVDTCCYDGVPQAIKKLKENGVRLGVVTNKPDFRAAQIVNTLYGEDTFDVIAGHTDDFPLKPDPALPLNVMNRLGGTPGETVFIGDSSVDMITAKNCGFTSIGVLWGFRSQAELEENGAEFIAKTPDDLIKYILD